MTVPCLILLGMSNILDKVVEKIKTHILCLVAFFPESRFVYEIISKHEMKPERPEMRIQYRRSALHAR
jgi:hypothetical protein